MQKAQGLDKSVETANTSVRATVFLAVAEVELDDDGLGDFDGIAVEHGGTVFPLSHGLAGGDVEQRVATEELNVFH